VIEPLAAAAKLPGNAGSKKRRSKRAVMPFLVGVATGGVAGAIVGTLVGEEVVQVFSSATGKIERKLTKSERNELRFELLLQ